MTQPYSYYHILGRETFLAPVDWPKGGWPQVNGDGIIDLDMQVPTLPQQPFVVRPTRIDFDVDTLDVSWQFLRNPLRENYSLTERPGSLRIQASAVRLDDVGQVSMVCRRQTQHDFIAETALELLADKENEEAGMTLVQNNTHHYELLLKRKGKQYVLQLRVSAGSLRYVAAEKLLSSSKLQLRITGTPLQYNFSYQEEESKDWTSLGNMDTRYLSTEVAGGFTGVMIGLYASSNGQPSKAKAYFDWFDYRAGQ